MPDIIGSKDEQIQNKEYKEFEKSDLQLEEGDEPYEILENTPEELESKKVTKVNSALAQASIENDESIVIDWSVLRYEDKEKRIPEVSTQDVREIIQSGILQLSENDLTTMMRMARQMITDTPKEDEPIRENGFTDRQNSGRKMLAEFQTLARDTIAKIKSKENIIRAIHFQCIREAITFNIEKVYKSEPGHYDAIHLGKIGFFANILECFSGNDEEREKSLKKITGDLFDVDKNWSVHKISLAILKKFYENKYNVPFIIADRKVEELKEKVFVFRELLLKIALDIDPEIDLVDSHGLSDPDSEVSRELSYIASSGMFERGNYDRYKYRDTLVDFAKTVYKAKNDFIDMFNSSKNPEKAEAAKKWLNELNVYWGNKLRYYQQQSGKNIKELRESFGALTDYERELIKNGTKVEDLPRRELSNNLDRFIDFKKQGTIFDGCAIIARVIASNYHKINLNELFAYLHSLIFSSYFNIFMEEFLEYEPNKDIEKIEDDENFIDYSVLFKANVDDESGEAIKDNKKMESYKNYLNSLKATKGKQKHSPTYAYTVSSIKNAAFDNINISMTLLEAVENTDTKIEKIKTVMGDFYDEQSVLTALFMLMDKKESFSSILESICKFDKDLFTIFDNLVNSLSIKVPEPIGGNTRRKKLSKKERKKLKERINNNSNKNKK